VDEARQFGHSSGSGVHWSVKRGTVMAHWRRVQLGVEMWSDVQEVG
jgi:hypothetical protein